MRITYKAIAERLNDSGVKISANAVGDYLSGRSGSRYAAHINRAVWVMTQEAVQALESELKKIEPK
jgi:DNA transposition AAA+ family ATPase